MTLTEFLLARIAEDEAEARAASPGPWRVNAESDTVLAVDDIEVCEAFALSGQQLRATAEFVARHDPARVLAECERDRLIVERLGPVAEVSQPGAVAWECFRLLALPHADHPDYDETWRP